MLEFLSVIIGLFGIVIVWGGFMYDRLAGERDYFRKMADFWFQSHQEIKRDLDNNKNEADWWK